MAETIKESLFDKLLKSRYPLTNYLSRQQKFVKVFLTTQVDTTPISIECETNLIRRRKTPHPSYYNKADTINPQVPEFYDAQPSDQDYNTAHDRSSETDDDTIQEYDARPLSKSKSKLDQISQPTSGKNALKQQF